MFGSGILDTVIGLIFVFLLVSVLVTIVNEMIAAVLMSRAKWLRRGIDRLIGSEWMEKVYAHPLIEGTARKDNTWIIERGPSYIPSRSFANVLMSVIQENSSAIAECQKALRAALDSAARTGATVENLKVQLSTAAGQMRAASGIQAAVASDLVRYLDANGSSNTRTWLCEVDSRVRELNNVGRPELAPFLQTLELMVADGVNTRAGIEELRQRFDAAVTTLLTGPSTMVLREELTAMGKRLQGPYTVADAYADIEWFIDGISARYVRQTLEALPAGNLQKTLLTLFDDAKNDVEKLKENIEVWFNNGMDRVNGWYKRRSQLVIAILALVMAVAMNVDAILVFRHLQTYPAVGDAIAGQAMQFAKKNSSHVQGALIVADGEAFSGDLTLKPADNERNVTITSDNPHAKVRTSPVKVDKDAKQVPFTVDVDMRSSENPGTATIKSEDASNEVKLTLAPSLLGQFNTVQKKLTDLTIPIGWVKEGTKAQRDNGQILPKFSDLSAFGDLAWQHALGWLLTALAATLGAPFWFDILNRVISIRAAGKPPEEEPKPPKAVSVPVEPGQSQQEADRLRQGEPRRR
jgi:hypothetical protein